jgi:predicted lipoprotein with Yx(FWY)xxD motif
MRTKILTKLLILTVILFVSACNPLAILNTPTATSSPQAGNSSAVSTPVATNTEASIPASGEATTQPPATATPEMNMSGMTEAPSANGSPMIKVSDQAVNMGLITIDEVVSEGSGWVVIYTTKSNGQPDKIIGHSPVKDGGNDKVTVQVDTNLAKGTLYAQLQADRGKVGTFEFPGPDEPVMVGVQMISTTFKATQMQAEVTDMPGMENTSTNSDTVPSITITNQPIKDGKIVIPEVVTSGDTWVVIHRRNGDGTMGAMVGFAEVKDGVNKNVVVPVDTNNTSQIMFAMLHQNIAKKSSPQFPGVDGPVMVNGQMVAPSFEITTNTSADVYIGLGSQPETHNYLVDANDMTLYVSLRDAPGKSNCDANCQQTWRPLQATGRIVPGEGVNAKNLGVILLQDGTRQITYLGAPLYLYTGDQKPGDVNGQGLEGTWYLVAP